MDFNRREDHHHPPKFKSSFTSFLFSFGKKRETHEQQQQQHQQQIKKPLPMHNLHTSSSSIISMIHLEPPGLKTLTSSSPLNPNRSLITCFFKPTRLISFSSSSSSSSLSTSSPSSSSSLPLAMDQCEKERDRPNGAADDDDNSPGINNGPEDAEEEEEEEEEKEIIINTHKTHERRISEMIYSHQLSHRRRRSRSEKREFPPPIPLLARTGNLPCHMPWVLRRIRDNGRLVIQEVKVKRHEFFRAHRANGRLTLQLMHLDESSDLLFNHPPPPTQDPYDPHLLPENEKKKDPTTQDDLEEEEEETQEEEEEPILKDTLENNPSSSSKEKRVDEDSNPSTASPCKSLSPTSMSSGGHKKNPTPNLCFDEINGPLQEKFISSPWEKKKNNNKKPDVSQMGGSLPCTVLSSSLPESPIGIGGNGGSCFARRTGPYTFFEMPAPTIRLIHG